MQHTFFTLLQLLDITHCIVLTCMMRSPASASSGLSDEDCDWLLLAPGLGGLLATPWLPLASTFLVSPLLASTVLISTLLAFPHSTQAPVTRAQLLPLTSLS